MKFSFGRFTTSRMWKNRIPLRRSPLVASTVALVSVLALIMLDITPAQAYKLTGAHWPSVRNLQYQLVLIYGGSTNAAAWNNAASNWTSTATPLYFTRTNSNASIQLSDQSTSSVGWDGLSSWSPATGTLTHAIGYLNVYYTDRYSANTRKGVAAHELGHILGLAHNSGCVLMTPTTPTRNNCGIYAPVADEINGVNALY